MQESSTLDMTTTSVGISLSAPTKEVVRRCENPKCAKPMTPREKESPSRFKARRHCDTMCARTNPLVLAGQMEQWKLKRAEQKKECVVCHEEFHRGKDEATKIFENRPTCGKPCAFEKRKRELEEERKKHPKTCTICAGEFYRRRKETTKVFAARNTCGLKCAQRARRAKWTDKKSVNGQIRAAEYEAQRLLPPVTPLKREIPDEPRSEEIEVWRPASWGGSYKRKVS